jgi:YHS domain-containing protein
MRIGPFLTLATMAGFTALLGCQNAPAPPGVGASAAPAGTEQPPTGATTAEPGALRNGFETMPAPGTKAVCPVMGDEFEVKADSSQSVYKGKTYVFCCPACKPKFEADPEKYLKS